MFIINLIIFLAGASVFSFVNVVAFRLPRGLNYVNDRSKCPVCDHALNAFDLMPVFGYIFLKGKCRYCKTHISIRYFLMELLGGALFLFSGFRFGLGIKCILYFAFFSILICVFLIDMETMEIPNGLVIAILILSVFHFFLIDDIPILHRIIGFFAVSVPMLILAMIVKGGFGGGDIKLMAASGLILGFKLILLSAFIAIMAGGVYAVYLLITKKAGRKSHFAFGPFLCIGMIISTFFGNEILNGYFNII